MAYLSFTIFTLTILFWGGSHSKTLERAGTDVELIENGATYKIISMRDGMVITVLDNGIVVVDEWTGSEKQKWTIYEHPTDRLSLEFKNYIVPSNDLSGYDNPDNPFFPRPLGLNKHRIMPDLTKEKAYLLDQHIVPWQILIRNRWCLQNNGQQRQLDIDDCEYEPADWQFWQLELVQRQPAEDQAEPVSV